MATQQSEHIAERVIVVVDLSRFSDIACNLEQQLGPRAVAELVAQIKQFIHRALSSVPVNVNDITYEGTGDGAILSFNEAQEATAFAEHLHRVTELHNSSRSEELARRYFRVGVWSDSILVRSEVVRGSISAKVMGSAISNAVRLESACATGEVLISSDTWADLPRPLRRVYGPEECVKGKREERFRVHRRRIIAPAPWDRREGVAADREHSAIEAKVIGTRPLTPRGLSLVNSRVLKGIARGSLVFRVAGYAIKRWMGGAGMATENRDIAIYLRFAGAQPDLETLTIQHPKLREPHVTDHITTSRPRTALVLFLVEAALRGSARERYRWTGAVDDHVASLCDAFRQRRAWLKQWFKEEAILDEIFGTTRSGSTSTPSIWIKTQRLNPRHIMIEWDDVLLDSQKLGQLYKRLASRSSGRLSVKTVRRPSRRITTFVGGPREPQALLDQSFLLYQRAFPQKSHRDSPGEIREWLESAYLGRETGESPWREFWTVLHRREDVLGICFLSGHANKKLCFGNYLAVRPNAEEHDNLRRLMQGARDALIEEIPDLKAIVFEADYYDQKLIERIARKRAITDRDVMQVRDDATKCKFIQKCQGRLINARCLLTADGFPAFYKQPSMERTFSPQNEVRQIFMVRPEKNCELTATELLDFVYDDLFGDARDAGATWLEGNRSYVAKVKHDVISQTPEMRIGLLRPPEADMPQLYEEIRKRAVLPDQPT